MMYQDLKEMTFKDWDGKPFRAIVNDIGNECISGYDIKILNGEKEASLITGFNMGSWMDVDCNSWAHAYPIECNKKPKKRMTNRQLAMWLAKGNGQVKYVDGEIYTIHSYTEKIHPSNEVLLDDIKVRKWDSEEWIEPDVDLLEDK